MAFTLQLDDPSILLLTLIITLALLNRSGIFTAQPAAHPLVFAKQGEPSPVRKEGRSAVYRHWSGNTAVVPASGVRGVREIVAARNGDELFVDGKGEDVWITSGRLANGLNRLVPTTNGAIPIVTYLPTNQKTLRSLILLNLVPAHSNGNGYHLVTPSSREHLSTALADAQLVFTRAEDVPEVLSAISNAGGWIILPSSEELTSDLQKRVQGKGWHITTLYDVVASGEADLTSPEEPSDPAQVHAVYIADGPDGKPTRRMMTNQNITAALVALLALFPGGTRPTKRHTLLTSVDIAQPIGLAIVMLAIYSGKGLRWIDPKQPIDKAASVEQGEKYIAFLSTEQLTALTQTISGSASSHPLYSFAKRRKEGTIYEGALSRGGWLDRAVFADKRLWAEKLSSVVLVDSAGPTTLHVGQLADALVHLSVPIIRTLTSPNAAGPICATHHHDLQLVPSGDRMHVGPPAAGVEIELRGEEVRFADQSVDPKGLMYVRGPTILRDASQSVDYEGWTGMAQEATVRSNGTFVIM